MGIPLYKHQYDTIQKMHNGCLVCGGTGSGKSRTVLAFYLYIYGSKLHSSPCISKNEEYSIDRSCTKNLPDLYIITTAHKRDLHEWEKEMMPFLLSTIPENNNYNNKIFVDSWNNIDKYVKVKNAFFIFDEQKVVGYGLWAKSFIEIAQHNQWILLSATPGDKWEDYMAVFIANGFYKHKTDFVTQHIIYNYRVPFPIVDRYINEGRLIRLRNQVLIDMEFDRHTVQHHIDIFVEYDRLACKELRKNRFDYEHNQPFKNISQLCVALRKIVNSDPSRGSKVEEFARLNNKIIIFYNYNFERDILLSLDYPEDMAIAEWNGHKHQSIPDTDKWVYIVQYTSGCEGWNCVDTNIIIFYSENYSYKVMVQAAGRIDRLNTKYTDLYYYHLKSRSDIDLAIARAIKKKKKFNESRFING